jgi:hypothetical protein
MSEETDAVPTSTSTVGGLERDVAVGLREVKPAIADVLKTGEIRIVEVISSDYEGFGPGGLVKDLELGLGTVLPHHSAFRRIAVVSDKEWVAHSLHALAWMVPGELAVFGLDELERAKQWAAS